MERDRFNELHESVSRQAANFAGADAASIVEAILLLAQVFNDAAESIKVIADAHKALMQPMIVNNDAIDASKIEIKL